MTARPPVENQIVAHQPVGTLIVDHATVVRFANPAAADMLGIPVDQLVGEVFGLPIVPDGLTDVNVPDAQGTVRTLAMLATELPGGESAHVITLFDVSGRARVYEHEHRLVESLQRSLLLDQMPDLPGISLAARYVPGEGDVGVGGDWYDVIPLPDGRIGLVIGDVAGHGLGSAALMSQLRNAVRAYALEHPSPATVLSRLDELINHLEPGGMATAIYLTYNPHDGQLTFAAAGHPYPLVVRPDGTREFLTGGRSLPLGTGVLDQRGDSMVTLLAGSTLVIYTDGLIERRTEPIDEGLASLASSPAFETPDPTAACAMILAELLGGEPPMDDVALLVMHTSNGPGPGDEPIGTPDQLLSELEDDLLLGPTL